MSLPSALCPPSALLLLHFALGPHALTHRLYLLPQPHSLLLLFVSYMQGGQVSSAQFMHVVCVVGSLLSYH
jgi:hypothetical protein